MAPNKETLRCLGTSFTTELSTRFNNACDEVFTYAMSSPTQQQETTAGTLFGAYNAVTGYFQNVRDYKNEEAKFKSIMGGTAQLRAQSAFNLCLSFDKNGADILNFN